MARGQGLEHTQEYQWLKQPNGRYTVFDVPIFAMFQDEKRGEVNQQDLSAVIHNFQDDKLKNFRYPRIHIGHHEGNENRPGAGYLDNMRLQNETVFADLVEVTPEVFQAIRNKMKFPYVSAEYHPEKQKILSLALLESQSPYFSFPLLKLEDRQTTAANFDFGFPALRLQASPEDISHFQDAQAAWACRDTVLRFQENFQGCPCMDDQEKDKDKKTETEGASPSNEVKEPMTEEAPKQYKCQDDIVGMGDMMKRLLAKVEQIFAWEQAEHEGGMENELGEEGIEEPAKSVSEEQSEEEFSANENPLTPSKPMKGLDNPMKKPSSVAYQADRALLAAMQDINKSNRSLLTRVENMEKMITGIQTQQKYSMEEKNLQQFCDEHGLDFQEQSEVCKQFSSEKDRKAYMDAIVSSGVAPRHPASRVAQKALLADSEKMIVQNFQHDDPATHKRAREALQFYNKVVNFGSEDEVSFFQGLWSDKPDRFVSYCAKNPGALEKMQIKGV